MNAEAAFFAGQSAAEVGPGGTSLDDSLGERGRARTTQFPPPWGWGQGKAGPAAFWVGRTGNNCPRES